MMQLRLRLQTPLYDLRIKRKISFIFDAVPRLQQGKLCGSLNSAICTILYCYFCILFVLLFILLLVCLYLFV
jgi:hypothetical protein